MKEITMPKLSDTMTEGTVVAWRKAVGVPVERGEVIAEVETDKATMELEAFASGILLEIRVAAGTAVPVGTVIGLIGAAGERPEAGPAVPQESAPAPEVPAAPPEPRREPLPPPAAVSPGLSGEAPAAPVVRLRARELGIDLATVTGSGPGGRILLEDLERHRPGQGGSSRPEPMAGITPAPVPAATVPPARADRQESPAALEPLSRMRAAIARTVTDSWHTIPHFSVAVDVRMDAAEQLRQQLKGEGQPVSLTALLVRATALTLRDFPRLNASLHDGQLLIHPDINIGVVVRRNDGLLVPVLHGCAGLSLAETGERTAQLAARARQGQLSQTELAGGTFAISNLGMYGADAFVALILPPMSAVLAVGRVREAVVAAAGQPVVARTLTLTLSADHRVVDGVYAAEFLQQLKRLLEQPEGLAV